jgi:MerR family copper efflux transcriptional regulator
VKRRDDQAEEGVKGRDRDDGGTPTVRCARLRPTGSASLLPFAAVTLKGFQYGGRSGFLREGGQVRIGELAQRAGLSTKTLRYYEAIGVLTEPERTSSGYRDYPTAALDVLRFVRSAQTVGLTLGEIKGILAYRDRGETPCGHVLELIRRRADEIEQQITRLEEMRAELRRLERRARALRPEECAPAEICHVIPRA